MSYRHSRLRTRLPALHVGGPFPEGLQDLAASAGQTRGFGRLRAKHCFGLSPGGAPADPAATAEAASASATAEAEAAATTTAAAAAVRQAAAVYPAAAAQGPAGGGGG